VPSGLLWVRNGRILRIIPHSKIVHLIISWFLHAVKASCCSVARTAHSLLGFWNRPMIFERLTLYLLKTLIVKSALSVVIVWIQLEVHLTFRARAYHSIPTFLTWPKHLREQRSLFRLMWMLIQYLSKMYILEPFVIFFLFIGFADT
jgi:hypothetical protein